MNEFIKQLWFGWPWMGLGIGIIMTILLFTTDIFRAKDCCRWRDPVWLTWFAMPMYLLHQFEEYSCHVVEGEYYVVSTLFGMENFPFPLDNLPMAHFPVVNIVFVWMGIPVAAWLCRKYCNPALGLSYYGFVLLNGVTHLASVPSFGFDLFASPGSVTGVVFFLPVFVWTVYVTLKDKLISGKELALALCAGVLSHIFLFAIYPASNISGVLAIVLDVLCGFAPVLLTTLGYKLLRLKNRVAV